MLEQQTRNDSEARIFLASQKVTDIRLPPSADLTGAARELAAYYETQGRAGSDKIPLEIGARPDASAILRAAPGVTVGAGGNLQNMIVDLGLIAAALRRLPGAPALHLVAASSSPPAADLAPDIASELRSSLRVFDLPVPDRIAVHVPLGAGSPRTLVLSTSPLPIWPALDRELAAHAELRSALDGASVVALGEPIVALLDHPPGARPLFVLNPATAYRVAASAASLRPDVVLTMNGAEARAACALLVEAGRLTTPPPRLLSGFFGAPVWQGIWSCSALTELDRSVAFLLSVVGSWPERARSTYACPVTFGRDGGVLASVQGDDRLACWTSIPDGAGELMLRARFCEPVLDRGSARPTDVGAGDAHAAVVAFANALGPERLMARYLPSLAGDEALRIAGLVFTGALGRLASALVLSTPETFMPIRPERLAVLMDELARSVAAAIGDLDLENKPCAVTRLAPWGIHVAVWRVGAPDRDAARRGHR